MPCRSLFRGRSRCQVITAGEKEDHVAGQAGKEAAHLHPHAMQKGSQSPFIGICALWSSLMCTAPWAVPLCFPTALLDSACYQHVKLAGGFGARRDGQEMAGVACQLLCILEKLIGLSDLGIRNQSGICGPGPRSLLSCRPQLLAA